MVKLTHFDVNQITPFSIGFDRVFDRLVDYGTTYETGGFPPYNIRKTDDFKHVIEIALAGFSKDEITVETETNVLKVASKTKTGAKEQVTYLHNGLSKRAFTNTWQLGDDVKVSDVSYTDGLLTVKLEKIIPEHQRKISYKINEELPAGRHEYKKVLLTE